LASIRWDRPYELDTWNQTDFVKVKKFAGYWQKGLPKLDTITWRPVVDNNTRAAMLQTGEAQFAFPIPMSRRRCEKQQAGAGGQPVDHAALHQHERHAKAVR
jgi:ABC-type transport system substrate-binding protein